MLVVPSNMKRSQFCVDHEDHTNNMRLARVVFFFTMATKGSTAPKKMAYVHFFERYLYMLCTCNRYVYIMFNETVFSQVGG